MPFDGLTHGLPPLAALLRRHHLEPISDDKLRAHKEMEVRRHPANYLHKNPNAIWSVMSVGVVFVIIEYAMSLMLGYPNLIVVGMLVSIALVIYLNLARARGPAYWQEEWTDCLLAVPEPIAHLAERLKTDNPNVAFYIGELKQDHLVLDPYLLVRLGGETACLGIWDDRKNKIIAIAEVV
jgi:hypothetical protein